jgi:pyruvate,water dikinase
VLRARRELGLTNIKIMIPFCRTVNEGRDVLAMMEKNGLTHLTLGLDRDSGTVARLFDERNEAVRWLIARAIAAARQLGKPIGICGQAPSDYPEFAEWLVREHIDSISPNPDVAITTALRVARAEGAGAAVHS